MATWYVRPLLSGGWQVLTPGYTQACAVCTDPDVAVRAARTRIADEGGGQLAVLAETGELAYTVAVAASHSPYDVGLTTSG